MVTALMGLALVQDEVELFPGADSRTVGDQGCRSGVLGADEAAVDGGAKAHTAVGVVDDLEPFRRTDGRRAGYERGPATVGCGHDAVVGVRPQRDGPVPIVYAVELLPCANRGTVRD